MGGRGGGRKGRVARLAGLPLSLPPSLDGGGGGGRSAVATCVLLSLLGAKG